MAEAISALAADVRLNGPTKNVFRVQDSFENLATVESKSPILKHVVPVVDGTPDLLFSDELAAQERDLGITMPVDRLLKVATRITAMIGVSGCGKTRTCYDYCRHRWALYFDCFMDGDFL